MKYLSHCNIFLNVSKAPYLLKYKVNGTPCDGIVTECAPGCPAKIAPILNTPNKKGFAVAETADGAKKILNIPDRIKLSDVQSTGKNTASLQNLIDAADEKCGKSGFKKECVYISAKLVNAMITISDKYAYSVSAINGGDHCKGKGTKKGCLGVSNHYSGQAFDVNFIGDTHVAPNDGNSYNFMKQCLALGFNDVLGPKPFPKGARNNKDHNDHVHCGFK